MSDIVKYDREEKRQMRSLMRSMIGLLPNLVKLLYRLVRDPRVARTEKAVLAGTIIYVIAPLDFLPDLIPFIGQVDDMYLVAIAVLRLLNRTSAEVVDEHWEGPGNIKSVASAISEVAGFFLPRRIKNFLVGKLEQPASITNIDNFLKNRDRHQEVKQS